MSLLPATFEVELVPPLAAARTGNSEEKGKQRACTCVLVELQHDIRSNGRRERALLACTITFKRPCIPHALPAVQHPYCPLLSLAHA